MEKLEYVEQKIRIYERLATQWAALSHEQIAYDAKTICVYASLSYADIAAKYARMSYRMRH
jgi:hypothetical protein